MKHSIEEYVQGNVHPNNIGGFWSAVGGTYTHFNPRHLDRYLSEQVCRFDQRKNADRPRFLRAKATDRKRDDERLTER